MQPGQEFKIKPQIIAEPFRTVHSILSQVNISAHLRFSFSALFSYILLEYTQSFIGTNFAL